MVVQASRALAGVEVNAWGAVTNWRTWYLAVINLCDATVKYAIIYWCPLIIYHMVGTTMTQPATGEAAVPHDAVVALLTAMPFGLAAVLMLVNAKHSAATGQNLPSRLSPLNATCVHKRPKFAVHQLAQDTHLAWYMTLAGHLTHMPSDHEQGSGMHRVAAWFTWVHMGLQGDS